MVRESSGLVKQKPSFRDWSGAGAWLIVNSSDYLINNMDLKRSKNFVAMICTLVLTLPEPTWQRCTADYTLQVLEQIGDDYLGPWGYRPHQYPGPSRFTSLRYSGYKYMMSLKCENENSIEDVQKEIAYQQTLKDVEYVQITNSDLAKIPNNFLNSSRISQLHIENSNVQLIETDAFNWLTNLQQLSLKRNKIVGINEQQFKKLSSLIGLDLSYNLISFIDKDMFKKLTNLKQLNLRNNIIDRLPGNVFGSLQALEAINLSSNKLETVDDNVFRTLTNLLRAILNNNRLTSLKSDLFKNNTKLRMLQLNNNLIAQLNLNLPDSCTLADFSSNHLDNFKASGLSKVEILDLSNNGLHNVIQVTESTEGSSVRMSTKQLILNQNSLGLRGLKVESFKIFKDLEMLSLDKNYIKSLNEGTFENNQYIKRLALSNNLFTKLDLTQIPKFMEELNLQSNRLSDLQGLRRFKNLSSLLLGFNSFTQIKVDLLGGLASLRTLKLNNNKISSFELGCFKDLKYLNLLDLSYNNIDHLVVGVFSGILQLSILSLAHNKLTTLDEGVLHSFRSLRELDLSYNQFDFLDTQKTLSHLIFPMTVALEGNNWSCSLLTKILREHRTIQIKQGNDTGVTNVRGVACTNDKSTSESNTTSSKIIPEPPSFLPINIADKLSTTNTMLVLIFLLLLISILLKYGLGYVKGLLFPKERNEQEMRLIS